MVYFFTYGCTNDFPFKGGWTEIECEDYKTAVSLFRCYHADKNGCMNYSFCYPEDQFMKSEMWKNGNYGSRCHERITVKRILN